MTVNRALYEPMARAAAEVHGVPPDLFAAQIQQESGFDPEAYNAASGASGLAQIVPASHPTVDPWNSPAALSYAAQWMAALHEQFGTWRLALAAYNAGPGNVQRYGGVPPFPETQRYLTAILGDGWPEPNAATAPCGFDPDTPDEYQVLDWTCSVRTATWLLRSIGVDVTAGDMQDRMVAAGLVTSASGLLDGSGAALAAWLAATFGVRASAYYPAEWSEVLDYAGDVPIGLGGRRWNHWVAVRGWTDAPALTLMNPAPGWMGISTVLTHDDWERLGPFAVIYLAVRTAPEEDELSAEERAELIDLRSRTASYENDTFTPMAQTMDAILAHPDKLKKAEIVGKVEEMRNSIRINTGI